MQTIIVPSVETRFCLFLKLYSRTEEQDGMLVSEIVPLLNYISKFPSFNSFFYIRYLDPDPHLRLRFFGERSFVMGEPRQMILQHIQCAAQKWRAKLVISKYRPEVRRYGGRLGVRLAETMFANSTQFVLSFLCENAKIKPVISRTEAGLISMMILLNGLGRSRAMIDRWIRHFSSHALAFLNKYNRTLRSPFYFPKEHRAMIDSLFRRTRQNPWGIWANHPRLQKTLREFYNSAREFRTQFDRWEPKINRNIAQLTKNYLHMHFNRLGLNTYVENIILSYMARFDANHIVR